MGNENQPLDNHPTTVRMAVVKDRRDKERVGEDGREREVLHCWWDINWSNHHGKVISPED